MIIAFTKTIYIYIYICIWKKSLQYFRKRYDIWFQAKNSMKCTDFRKNMRSIRSTRKNCNKQTKRKLFFKDIFSVYSFKLGSIFLDLKLVEINLLFHLHKLCKLSKRKHIFKSHTRRNILQEKHFFHQSQKAIFYGFSSKCILETLNSEDIKVFLQLVLDEPEGIEKRHLNV